MTLTVLPPASSLAEHAAQTADPVETLVKAWLAGQRSRRTFDTYATAIKQWRRWCCGEQLHELTALRAHVELYQRRLEQDGKAPRTIYARLTAMASFYNYLLDEDVIVRSPMRGVKRPRIERRSPTAWLTRAQTADMLIAVREHQGVHAYALMLVLVLNGLRIGEACSLDVTSLTMDGDGYTPVVHFIRKGERQGRAVLSRPTEAAVLATIGDRVSGPLFLNSYGNRMTQVNAQRILDKAIRHVRGVHRRITPHTLRHTWTTLCVDAGVPVDQLQYDGGWADSRLIAYYSHNRDRADRAVTHAATAYVMGAA